MTFSFAATAMILALMGSVAVAQPAAPGDSVPAIVAPPAGVLSTTRTQHRVDTDGTVTQRNETTYRDETGVVDEAHATRATHPAATVTTSSHSSSSTTDR